MRRRLFNFLDNIRDTLLRILISVAGALFVALVTIVLLAPDSVRDFIDDIALIWRLLLLLIIYGITGFMVYQEFVLGGKSNVKGLIVKGEGGSVTELDVPSVQTKVRSAVANLKGISKVSASVKSVRGKALIDVSVTMQHESVNIPDKQREITRTLHQLVEKQLGIRMAEKPRIELTFGNGKTTADSSEERGGLFGRSKPETESQSPPPAQSPASATPSPADAVKPAVEAIENPLEAETDDKDDDPEFWSFLKSTEEKKDDTSNT